MPTQTDRDKFNDKIEGDALGLAGMADAKTLGRDVQSRCGQYLKTGTENAITNVAETPITFVPRLSRVRRLAIMVTTNIAANATDYAVIKFYGRKAGTSTLVGSWNTHTSAQGALTTAGPGVIENATGGLITNADGVVAASSQLNYIISKYGAGQALATLSVFSYDLEEI